MKTLYAYLNEKGQGLVEYTLILAFCSVLLTGLRSDEFNYTIRQVFENGVFDDLMYEDGKPKRPIGYRLGVK